MAVKLSKVFGYTEESWLARQAQYDLSQVRRDRLKPLRRLGVPGIANADFRRFRFPCCRKLVIVAQCETPLPHAG